MHIIKKYANRKLYSTKESTYVTLQDIADLITLEEEFQVVDNTTKTDVTFETVKSVVAELFLEKLDMELLKALVVHNNNVDTEQKDEYTNMN